MIHWSGYAEIWFGESAHLALARAVEQSGSDALSLFADAWLIEDRSITLHVETHTPRAEMIAVQRLLSELLLEAERGEAVIDVPPFERWSRSAGGTPSFHQLLEPQPQSRSTPVVDGDHNRETIPMSRPRVRGDRRPAPRSSSPVAKGPENAPAEPFSRTRRSS
jgi:hypothetical protein